MTVALSIQQPWAWLIVNGFKPVENRTWPTERRGHCLVHAGKKADAEAMADVLADRHPVTGKPYRFNAPKDMPLGGIVGEMMITGCVREMESNWFVGPYGFLIAKAAPLAFVPLRGQLGFFRVPDDLQVVGASPPEEAQASLFGD